MFDWWLDRWDRARASEGAALKVGRKFEINANLAFPDASQNANLEDLIKRVDEAIADDKYYCLPKGCSGEFKKTGNYLYFRSFIDSESDVNDLVTSKITSGRKANRAVLIFHHWNATSRQTALAKFLSKSGILVVEMALPHHLERARQGASHADYMLSSNIGRTILSFRQAVLDGQAIIRWLQDQGYQEVSVLGVSLGAWIAALVAASNSGVRALSLIMPGCSLADMVWTGQATESLRRDVEPIIDLPTLRKAWGCLDLDNYGGKLSRPLLDVQIILASRDKVVLPEYGLQLYDRIVSNREGVSLSKLRCGHYSIALLPYSAIAAIKARRFLTKRRLYTCEH